MKAKDAFQYAQGIRAYPFSTNAKVTGLMISTRFNWSKMSCAWPSNKVIAADTGLSVSAVVKAKKELIEAGFLEVQRQFNNSCKYTPMLPENIGDILENYRPGAQEQTYDSETKLKKKLKEKVKEKLQESDSNESSLSSLNQIKQEDIEPIFERNKEQSAAAAKIEAEDLLSW